MQDSEQICDQYHVGKATRWQQRIGEKGNCSQAIQPHLDTASELQTSCGSASSTLGDPYPSDLTSPGSSPACSRRVDSA